jgi:DNA-binding CsgD family transcriptional regulator
MEREGVMYASAPDGIELSPGLAQITAEPSRREYEVLALLTAGYPMKQIAYQLGITYRTVTFHKYRMMKRLGIKTNAGLVHYALRNGVVETKGVAPAA